MEALTETKYQVPDLNYLKSKAVPLLNYVPHYEDISY